jgi:non-heme chloroperoxidase
MHPDMIVSLAINEPPAAGILTGVPNTADMLKEWASNLAPARDAFKAGDTQRGVPFS